MATTYFYLEFPVNDDSILQLSDDQVTLKYFLKSILELKRLANENSIQIIYDSENVQLFKKEIENLAGFPLDIRLRNFIGKSALNFRNKPKQQNEISYFIWLLDVCSVKPLNNQLLAEIPEYWNENDQFLIINFSNEYDEQKRNFLPIFKDAWHQRDLPTFYKINFITDFEELELWLATYQNPKFSLLDRSRFEKTKFHCQSARIYKEIKTKWYWYLDMLHKDHYEVFDKTGNNHLGTSDLNGEISGDKKDNSRTIDIK